MINILIRTSNRPEEFKKCIASVRAQTYDNLRVIVCTDHIKSLDYIHENIAGLKHNVFTVSSTGVPFHWNFYCNNLKKRVNEGWFFYLDDDDYLIDKFCLQQISRHLIYHYQAVICQFARGARFKPDYQYAGVMTSDQVIRGKIGGSCIFLHHSQKNVADWDGQKAADYRFIKAVAAKIPMVFVPIPVVQAGNNGRKGK